MYSLLLMTAMAGSPDAAGFGWRTAAVGGGCYGSSCFGVTSCYGCTGYSSCLGCSGYSSCLGCTGYTACHGCTGYRRGGFLGLGLLDWGRNRRAVQWSSCHGAACYGGCWGSCYGSGYGVGCWGSCYGCTGCLGGCIGAPVVSPIPPATSTPAPATSGSSASPTSANVPARLTVELPATARLYVDGSLVLGTGSSRQFHTPELPGGQAFYYELKAEVEVNGKVEVEELKVVVRGGESVSASFPKLVAAVARENTAVAVK